MCINKQVYKETNFQANMQKRPNLFASTSQNMPSLARWLHVPSFLRVKEQIVTLSDSVSLLSVEDSVCTDKYPHCHGLPQGIRNLDLPLITSHRNLQKNKQTKISLQLVSKGWKFLKCNYLKENNLSLTNFDLKSCQF